MFIPYIHQHLKNLFTYFPYNQKFKQIINQNITIITMSTKKRAKCNPDPQARIT